MHATLLKKTLCIGRQDANSLTNRGKKALDVQGPPECIGTKQKWFNRKLGFWATLIFSTSLFLTGPFQKLSEGAIFELAIWSFCWFFIPDALRIEFSTLMFVKQLPRMIMSGSCLNRASTNFFEFSCEELWWSAIHSFSSVSFGF